MIVNMLIASKLDLIKNVLLHPNLLFDMGNQNFGCFFQLLLNLNWSGRPDRELSDLASTLFPVFN